MDYRKGADHSVPDALCRSSVNDPDKDDQEDLEFGLIAAITSEVGIQDLNIRRLEADAIKDDKYKALFDAVTSGFEQFRNKYV